MVTVEEQKKEFCENCSKAKDATMCIDVNGHKFCCADCAPAGGVEKPKKAAICEFC